jgi:cystathionine gamma-synthase
MNSPVVSSISNEIIGAVYGCHHGVVICFPTLDDIKRYETGDVALQPLIKCGYPRFVEHCFVKKLSSVAKSCFQDKLENYTVYLLISDFAAEKAIKYVGKEYVEVYDREHLFSLLKKPYSENLFQNQSKWMCLLISNAHLNAIQRMREYLQHTGYRISSRLAHDELQLLEDIDNGVIPTSSTYKDLSVNVKRKLAHLVGYVDENIDLSSSLITITHSGMTSFDLIYSTIKYQCLNLPSWTSFPKFLWMQIGWLYLDTSEYLIKMSTMYTESELLHLQTLLHEKSVDIQPFIQANRVLIDGFVVIVHSVHDKEAIEAVSTCFSHSFAGIVTEYPTNPLVQLCDLKFLRQVANKTTSTLIVDPTVLGIGNFQFFSPENISFAPDILTLSLTKYVSWKGNVMAGAILVNPMLDKYSKFLSRVPSNTLYYRDLIELSSQLDEYCDSKVNLREKFNENTRTLFHWLKIQCETPSQSGIARVYSILNSEYSTLSPGSMITIELAGTTVEDERRFHANDDSNDSNELKALRFHDHCEQILSSFFNNIKNVAKGPSFGTEFPIVCPFLYLAHYNLLSSIEGRAKLRAFGLNPYLIRISCGARNPNDLIQDFLLALDRRKRVDIQEQ